jgi:hypothetical protein
MPIGTNNTNLDRSMFRFSAGVLFLWSDHCSICGDLGPVGVYVCRKTRVYGVGVTCDSRVSEMPYLPHWKDAILELGAHVGMPISQDAILRLGLMGWWSRTPKDLCWLADEAPST